MPRFELRQPRRIAVVAAILLAGACAPASAGAPTERLREFFARVNGVLSDPATESRPLARLEQIRRMVRDLADMRGAAAEALGAAWDTRTPAEREEFVALFAELLERAYVARFAGAVRGSGQIALVYVDERVAGADATVVTRLRSGGGELAVDYRMTARDGRWRVKDVVLDGVSTVGNYRAQFRRLAAGGGHAGVVGHLRAKLGEETLLFARAESQAVTPSHPVPAPQIAAVPSPPAVSTAPPAPVATAPPRAPARAVPTASSPASPGASARVPSFARGAPTASRAASPAPETRPSLVAVAIASPARTVSSSTPRPASESPQVSMQTAAVPAGRLDLGRWLVALAFVVGAAAICRRWRPSAK